MQVRIIVIGAKTQLQRCANAADLLPDPVDIFVSYEYEPGGTVSYTNFSQRYQASLDMFEFYNVYVRFRDSSSDIRSGTPTTPLDETRNTTTGARVDYPATDFITVGGEVIYEEEVSSITSFDRKSLDAYVQLPLFAGNLSLSSQRSTIDYVDSDEDSDLTRYGIQYGVRPWNRAVLILNYYQEEDTGGTLTRETRNLSANLSWRIRQLTVTGELRNIEEIQGTSERERSSIRITARRDF